MRVALDMANILDRGTVKGTCNLLADGIVKLTWRWQPWRRQPIEIGLRPGDLSDT